MINVETSSLEMGCHIFSIIFLTSNMEIVLLVVHPLRLKTQLLGSVFLLQSLLCDSEVDHGTLGLMLTGALRTPPATGHVLGDVRYHRDIWRE